MSYPSLFIGYGTRVNIISAAVVYYISMSTYYSEVRYLEYAIFSNVSTSILITYKVFAGAGYSPSYRKSWF